MVRSLADALDAPVEWARPSDDLWVATQRDGERTWFLGFVELVDGLHVCVDGYGDLLGRFARIETAQAAFVAAAATAEPEPEVELEAEPARESVLA